MENPYNGDFSHWPPTVFDLCYFLERAHLSTPDLERGDFARKTRRWTESVAREVGLLDTLSDKAIQNGYDWWEIAHWSTRDQENLTEPIRLKYQSLEEEQQSRGLERVTSSNAQNERVASSNIQLQSLTLYDNPVAEEQEKVSPRDNFQGIPPPGASISIAVNNGAECLTLGGFFVFVRVFISQNFGIFVLQKSTNTKDHKRLCWKMH